MGSTRLAVGAACPVCGCGFAGDDERHVCPGCDTPHHVECWAYNEGCAIYACDGRAPEPTVAVPVPGRLPQAALDGRFRFVDGTTSTAALQWTIGLLVVSMAVVAALCTFGPLAGVATLAIGAVVQAAYRTTTRLDGVQRHFVRERMLGPYVLGKTTIPFDAVAMLTLDDSFLEHGTDHRRILRASAALRGGQHLHLALDVETAGVTDDAVDRWATALRQGTGLPIVRMPVPRRQILIKRIRAFQQLMATGVADEGPGRWWRRRWLAYPLGSLLASLVAPVWTRSVFFDGLTATMALVLLTLFFLFVRLHDLLDMVRTTERERLDPYPDPLLEYHEGANLQKLAGFLSLIEEKDFPSLRPPDARNRLCWWADALVFSAPVVTFFATLSSHWGLFADVTACRPAQLLFFGHLLVTAAYGAALQRARWDEDWVHHWLHESRQALEYDPGETGQRFRISDRQHRSDRDDDVVVIDKAGALPLPPDDDVLIIDKAGAMPLPADDDDGPPPDVVG